MPASYFTLEPGTFVTDRFGQEVGRVKKVLLADGSYFDGVIVTTRAGDRFVGAPEVRRITHTRGTANYGSEGQGFESLLARIPQFLHLDLGLIDA